MFRASISTRSGPPGTTTYWGVGCVGRGKLKIGEAQRKVAISDGAEWTQHQLRTRLPMVAVRVLDYFHLIAHVGQAAMVCFGRGSEVARQWRDLLATAAYKEGGNGPLVKIVETRRTMRSPARQEALRKLGQYVAKRVEMLAYTSFWTQGFDIGSGLTEAFCETLTACLKGSGMRWDRPHAEALMALAARWNRDGCGTPIGCSSGGRPRGTTVCGRARRDPASLDLPDFV